MINKKKDMTIPTMLQNFTHGRVLRKCSTRTSETETGVESSNGVSGSAWGGSYGVSLSISLYKQV